MQPPKAIPPAIQPPRVIPAFRPPPHPKAPDVVVVGEYTRHRPVDAYTGRYTNRHIDVSLHGVFLCFEFEWGFPILVTFTFGWGPPILYLSYAFVL
jgi:hypothetical protein